MTVFGVTELRRCKAASLKDWCYVVKFWKGPFLNSVFIRHHILGVTEEVGIESKLHALPPLL
ncbi:hypothetical protein Ciccas_002308 [Cichlidogyrus casuarinus]|uniref:Uncharacterized protein n=1 Tax=Cichlidogyrus casuarinus TaxID=1844966 RepID=A0ABD2QHI9_9PLAT